MPTPKGRWPPTIRRVDDAAAGHAERGARRCVSARRVANGELGNALRNLQRYVQQQSFDNPQGSGDAKG